MRKLHLILAAFTLLFVIFSCTKENNEVNNLETSEILEKKGDSLDYFALKFPEGTEITEQNNEIIFKLPEGYVAYGVDQNKEFTSFTEGKLTCTCIKGDGGCSPATVNNRVACVMTSCKSCEKSGSLYIGNKTFTDVVIFNLENDKLFLKASELNGEIELPSSFYHLDIVQNYLKELEKLMLPSNSTKTKIIPISIYGYVSFIEIPEDIDSVSPYISTDSFSCSCNSSSGICTKDKAFMARWCDASDCKSCTMTASITDAKTNTSHTIEINNHIISVN